jgi:hypothetical protein
MNTSTNNIYSSPQVVFHTALLFLVAVVLLVVSCPLKRVLQNDFTARSTSPVRTNQTNINQASASDYYALAGGCGIKQQVTFAKLNLPEKINIPTSTDLSYISRQAGFGLNYFLSGISYSSTTLVCSHHSSLPLFLQHLRLLI